MTGDWNHPVCERCWFDCGFGGGYDNDPVRLPARVPDTGLRFCCFCGGPTILGAFMRFRPDDLACKGQHA